MALETPCDFAKVRYVEIGRLRNTWSWLVFLIGAALAIFLILAILLFIRSAYLPGALTTLGTIVTGPALKWINDQRKTAVDEDAKAFADLERTCGPTLVYRPATAMHVGVARPIAGFTPLVGIESLAFDEPGEPETPQWYREIQAARQSAGAAKSYLATLRGEP
jgi:hypothetical protein